MKWLIWLVIVLAVIVWIKRAKQNLIRRARDAAAQAGGTARPQQSAGPAPMIEQMVQCAQCDLHFPASEAVQGSATDLVFCCPEHRKLHALNAGARS